MATLDVKGAFGSKAVDAFDAFDEMVEQGGCCRTAYEPVLEPDP